MTNSSRKVSFYLRGIAMISIVIYHYQRSYIKIDNFDFPFFGNEMVAIFLVLSGFGIYYSLDKIFNKSGDIFNKVGTFYLKRFLRIFPLYYTALFIDILFVNYYVPSHFRWLSVIGFEDYGIYWFISAIIQCYLISIVLYYALKKINIKNYLIIILVAFVWINLLYLFTPNPIDISEGVWNVEINMLTHTITYPRVIYEFVLTYQGLFLGHIFLFALGMSIPALIKRYGERICLKRNYPLLVPIILFAIIIFLMGQDFGNQINMLNSFLFVFITFVMILLLLANKVKYPLFKFFSLMGKYSLSLFLFHMIFYTAMLKLGIIQTNSLMSVIIVVSIFPGFFGFCALMETLTLPKSKPIVRLKKGISHIYENKKYLILGAISIIAFATGFFINNS